jgi:hypothetical protein
MINLMDMMKGSKVMAGNFFEGTCPRFEMSPQFPYFCALSHISLLTSHL